MLRLMLRNTLFGPLLLAIALVAVAVGHLPAQGVGGATVMSDAEDYAPGDVATIVGGGFWSDELIDVSISIDDPVSGAHVADYAYTAILADGFGGFVLTYEIPQEALDTVLTVTAIGLQSQLVATTTFTDSHGVHNFRFATSGLPAGTSITISGSRTNPGHNPAAYSVTFSSPGPSTNTGAQAGGGASTVSYSGFPAAVPGIGGDYFLQSTAPASGFATGASGGLTTVTATYLFVPSVVCPVNNPPTVSASDLNVGQVIGCLDGSYFEFVVSGLLPSDFAPVTGDPDGDPVSVALSVTDVILVGPGFAEATVTLTATDDPSGRNLAGCPALSPLSASVDVKVKGQVIYNFTGFGSPLSNTTTTIVKKGSTVPVKFQLSDCYGTPMTSGGQMIQVLFIAGNAPAGDPVVADSGSSNDNGVFFRYSDTNWIYNLSTKPTYYLSGNTYRISALLDDQTVRDVYFSVRK